MALVIKPRTMPIMLLMIQPIKMRILLLLIFLASFATLNAQNTIGNDEFILKGRVIGKDTGQIRLRYLNTEGKSINSITTLKGGVFFFSGFINEPTFAFLTTNVKSVRIDSDDPNYAELFLEPKTIKIVLKNNDFKHAIIVGSKTQDEWKILKKKETLYNANLSNDELRKIKYKFALTHPQSFLSPYLILPDLSNLSIDSLKMLYNRWYPAVENSSDGKEVENKIRKREWTTVGSIAQDFSTTDIMGKSLTLSSFRGKSYVLLDFWASWCVPCRASMPELRMLYSKYHSKGLDIIGISMDLDREAWSNAILHDSTSMWHHVLIAKNLMQPPTPEDIISKYEVNGLPTEILIDKRGMIIGIWNGNGEGVNDALTKSFERIFD